MKIVRTENVTKTNVYRGKSDRWYVQANGVVLGYIGVARHQPDPMSFRSRELAREKAKQLRVVAITQAYNNGPVYAVQQ